MTVKDAYLAVCKDILTVVVMVSPSGCYWSSPRHARLSDPISTAAVTSTST